MQEYLTLFQDKEYPYFLDKYLKTKTLTRIKHVTQFCGCDYTKLYNPKFLYTRFDHSLVVAHMTWHFTHNKIETIAALLHDIGTPCFAHCIDYVFGDFLNQESSEKDRIEIIKKDKELLKYLEKDNITINSLKDLSLYPILENKSPKLCTDRLDGVLHTCYIWLHTHALEEIKEVYDDLTLLINEEGRKELDFKTVNIALKFVSMVQIYAKELQGNKDKYVMKYISEVVGKAYKKGWITIDDLYTKPEKEIITILSSYIPSFFKFREATKVIGCKQKPIGFFISFATKKRNVIPLVRIRDKGKRITDVSKEARQDYTVLEQYQDEPYAYIETIQEI